jgi:hypothetical protein
MNKIISTSYKILTKEEVMKRLNNHSIQCIRESKTNNISIIIYGNYIVKFINNTWQIIIIVLQYK